MTFNTCERNLVISSSLSEHSRVLKLKRFFLLFRCLEDGIVGDERLRWDGRRWRCWWRRSATSTTNFDIPSSVTKTTMSTLQGAKWWEKKRSWKSSRYARWIRNIFALDFAISALTCKWFICKQFLVRWHLVIFFCVHSMGGEFRIFSIDDIGWDEKLLKSSTKEWKVFFHHLEMMNWNILWISIETHFPIHCLFDHRKFAAVARFLIIFLVRSLCKIIFFITTKKKSLWMMRILMMIIKKEIFFFPFCFVKCVTGAFVLVRDFFINFPSPT